MQVSPRSLYIPYIPCPGYQLGRGSSMVESKDITSSQIEVDAYDVDDVDGFVMKW